MNLKILTVLVLAAGAALVLGLIIGEQQSIPVVASKARIARDAGHHSGRQGVTKGHRRSAEGSAVGALDSSRELIAGASVTAPNPATMRVRVIEESSGKSLPGAEVRFLSQSFRQENLSKAQHQSWRLLDAEQRCTRFGELVLADSDGWVVLPAVGPFLKCCARSGNLYCEAVLNPGLQVAGQGLELRLAEDICAAVQVHDLEGRPVIGAPVIIRTMPASNGQTYAQSFPAGRSMAPRGDLSVRHLQLARRRFGIMGESTVDTQLALGLDLIGGAWSGHDFTPESTQAEPFILSMPETGSLRVDLRDLAGEHVDESAQVTIRWLGHAANSSGFRAWQRPLIGGQAEISHVVLGESFELSLRARNEIVTRTVRGPVLPDECVPIELRLANKSHLVVGQAVNLDGKSMSEVRIHGSVMIGGLKKRERIATKTDAGGWFRVHLPQTVTGKDVGPLELVIISVGSHGKRHDHARTFPLGVLPTSTFELGRIVFAQLPLIASGIVVDEAGMPLVAKGSVYGMRRDSAGDGPWKLAGRFQSNTSGQFEVRGPMRVHRARLHLGATGRVTQRDVEFSPGANDLRIELCEAGAAQVHVLVDASITNRDLVLTLVPAEHAIDRRLPAAPDSRSTGLEKARVGRMIRSETERLGFQWSALSRGDTILHVGLRTGQRPVLVRVPLTIVPGQVVRHEVDLRGRLRVVEITVTGAGNLRSNRGDAGVVFICPQAPETTYCGVSVRSGRARIVTEAKSLDLLVAWRGFQTQLLHGVSTATVIELVAAPEIQIRLATHRQALPSGYRLQVTLTPDGAAVAPAQQYRIDGETRGGTHLLSSLLGETTELGREPETVQLGRAGQYRVTAALLPIQSMLKGDSISATPVPVRISPKIINVLDREAQEFTLAIDSESLRVAATK